MKSVLLILILLSAASLNAFAQAPNLFQQGLSLYQKGRYESAVKILKKALKANKKNAEIAKAVGDAYLKLGKNQEALGYYQQSLALNPDNPVLASYVAENSKPLVVPTPVQSARPIEISLSYGPNFPFQSNSIAQNWGRGTQTSLFLGVRPFPRWTFGFQLDSLNFSQYQPVPNIPAYNAYPYYTYTQGADKISVVGGNIAFVGKYYFTDPEGPAALYLMGGPGMQILYHSGYPLSIRVNNSAAQLTDDLPEYTEDAFSIQGGLGFPIRMAEGMALLLELRAIYAFTDQPLFYCVPDFGIMASF